VAALHIPARIVWISNNYIRFECRASLRHGHQIALTGGIAQALGVQAIHVEIEDHSRDELVYRFSQAFIAKWRHGKVDQTRADDLLQELERSHTGPKYRLFVGIQKPDVRTQLVNMIDPEKFDIAMGLQKGTLSQEFKFYSPELIIFDDKLVSGINPEQLIEMFSMVSPHVPLVIMGKDFDQGHLRSILGDRPIFIESQIKSIGAEALSKYNVAIRQADHELWGHMIQVPPDHMISRVEIQVPARLQSISPAIGNIAVPFSLGNFALCRMEASIVRKALKRDPYIKIVESYDLHAPLGSGQFGTTCEFYLADVSQNERQKLGHAILEATSQYYSQQFQVVKLASVIALQATGTETAKPAVEEKPVELETFEPKPEFEIDLIAVTKRALKAFDIRDYISVEILKGFGIWIVGLMALIYFLWRAANVDPSTYEHHGKQYGDFFQRMRDNEPRPLDNKKDSE
jgi:hypothetical protein